MSLFILILLLLPSVVAIMFFHAHLSSKAVHFICFIVWISKLLGPQKPSRELLIWDFFFSSIFPIKVTSALHHKDTDPLLFYLLLFSLYLSSNTTVEISATGGCFQCQELISESQKVSLYYFNSKSDLSTLLHLLSTDSSQVYYCTSSYKVLPIYQNSSKQ